MKTLTVSEAARDLAVWLKQAVAGEEIAIRSENAIVELRPITANETTPSKDSLSPREALKKLQQEASLTPAQAESYLRDVYAERLAIKN